MILVIWRLNNGRPQMQRYRRISDAMTRAKYLNLVAHRVAIVYCGEIIYSGGHS